MNILFIGKSGSGKDFAREYLLTKGYNSIISHTTRPKRINETHAKDYFFISEQEFKQKLDSGYFIETRDYETLLNNIKAVWRYGTPFNEFNSNNSVGIKDLWGAKQIKDKIDNVKVIYIHCDDEVRESRAKARGTFCQTEWNRRLKSDAEDFKQEDILSVSDYYVNNNGDLDSFKEALDIVLEMIEENGR